MVGTALDWFSPVLLAASAKNPDDIPNTVVVLTGVALVFLILLILILIVAIQGGIFSSIAKKKKDEPKESAPAAPVQSLPAGPKVEAGIPAEVVAAIAVAVTAASDGAFVLRSVSAAQKGKGKWGLAGVIQSTEPF